MTLVLHPKIDAPPIEDIFTKPAKIIVTHVIAKFVLGVTYYKKYKGNPLGKDYDPICIEHIRIDGGSHTLTIIIRSFINKDGEPRLVKTIKAMSYYALKRNLIIDSKNNGRKLADTILGEIDICAKSKVKRQNELAETKNVSKRRRRPYKTKYEKTSIKA